MKKQRTKGQELVEFALVIPVFCLMLIGLFEIGRLIFLKHNLDKATREAARTAAVVINDADAKTTGDAMCRTIMNELNVPSSANCVSAVTNINNIDVVRVTATYLFQPMLSSGQFAVIPQLNLQSNSTMRKEG